MPRVILSLGPREPEDEELVGEGPGEPEAGTSLAMATGGPVECDQIDSDVSKWGPEPAIPWLRGGRSGRMW
jgi:hypothetical protein